MNTRIPTLMLMLVTALVASGCIAADDPPTDASGDTGEDTGIEGNITGNTTSGEILSTDLAWTLGATGCLTAGGLVVMLPDLDGVDFASVGVPAEAHGADFNATLTSAAPPVEWGVAFWEGDALADIHYSMGEEIDGSVPDGSDTAQLFSCGGAELSATFTVTA